MSQIQNLLTLKEVKGNSCLFTMYQYVGKLFGTYYVYFAAFSANLFSFSMGAMLNWSSTILPKLNSNDSDVNPLAEPLTLLESSWMVSTMTLACIVGPFIGGVVTELLGKKKTLIVFGAPMLIAHIMCAVAKSVRVFLVARFLMGISFGFFFSAVTGFIVDIAEDRNRGLLTTLMGIFSSSGGLFVFIIGPYVNIFWFSVIMGIPLALFFLLFLFFVPETPYDLVRKNLTKYARKSLAAYRGKSVTQVEDELQQITNNIYSDKKSNFKEALKEIFTTSVPLISFLKINYLLISFQICGFTAVLSYMQIIFDEAGGAVPPEYSVMAVGTAMLVATVICNQLIERLGRKLLLISSFLLLGLSLLALGTYFFLKDQQKDVNSISWLPITSLIIYVMAFNVGVPIPWVLSRELFVIKIEDTVSVITSIIFMTSSFVVTVIYPILKESIGIGPTFWVFGIFMALAFVFSILWVPETKGKSFQEIQDLLYAKGAGE